MLEVGLARVEITPPIGTAMAGHPGVKRSAGVLDDLYARVMVLKSGETVVAMVALDVLFISEESCVSVRNMAADRTDLLPENMFFFASHTHSGPMTTGVFGHKDEADYVQEMERRICAAIVTASGSTRPAQLGTGRTCVPGLSANARYIMKDGHIETHPWKGDPSIVRPEGPVDDDMLAIVIRDEQGKLLGGLINYANHPQIMQRDNPMISADFPGRMERVVRDRLGDDVVVLFGNGACGNLCPVDPLKTDRIEVGEEWMDHVGSTLAEKFIAITDEALYRSDINIDSKATHLPIPIRDISESKIQAARDFLAKAGSEPDRELKVSDWGVESPDSGALSLGDYLLTDEWKRQEYTDLLNLAERKSKSPVAEAPLAALCIGNAAIAMAPFELFAELGISIKHGSPFANTMVIELANGLLGYVPTPEAFTRPGGYETLTLTTSQLVPSAADMVVEESIRLLRKCE